MALPSFTVTGNVQEILSGQGADIHAVPLERARVIFRCSVGGDQRVRWNDTLYRVNTEYASVNTDGDIVTADDGPVLLLANDDGLSVDGIRWRFTVDLQASIDLPASTMVPRWFYAPGDGHTLDLKNVA